MPDQDFNQAHQVVLATMNYAVVPSAIWASFVGYLPIIAAVVGMIFYLLQIWESKTVQNWLERRRNREREDD